MVQSLGNKCERHVVRKVMGVMPSPELNTLDP